MPINREVNNTLSTDATTLADDSVRPFRGESLVGFFFFFRARDAAAAVFLAFSSPRRSARRRAAPRSTNASSPGARRFFLNRTLPD